MNFTRSTRRLALAAILLMLVAIPMVVAQLNPRSADHPRTEPDPSQGAVVSQFIGVNTMISIAYHRPGVKGRKLWTGDDPAPNSLVPHNENGGPWRAGANEATKIQFPEDVKIEGQPLPKGTYSFFIVPSGGDWTLIFNKTAEQWGAYTYKKADDALRVKVKPMDAPNQEWLMYYFDDLAANACTAYMRWGTKKVGFRIELASHPPAATPTPAN